jgi:hypothetical protein
MLPDYIKAGFALGVVLVCTGILINYLPIVQPMVIDPGPSAKSITVSSFIFTGINIIIISAFFMLRYGIRSRREALRMKKL